MTTKERTYDRVAKVHYSAYFEPELARKADNLMAQDGFTSRSAWLKAVVEWYAFNRPNINT